MAFIPGSIAEQYKKKTTSTGGFIPGSVSSTYTQKTPTASTFVPGSVSSTFAKPQTKDLSTSQGLYNLAQQSGLGGDADRVMNSQAGEETKKIFSGGFISDIFDVLNSLQYGVTGILKGKSFLEGVRTRQSFTDKDALGDKGLPGIIAGIALDIAVDPLTWIAPSTVVKKIPMAAKLIKAGEEAAFGAKVLKEIPATAKSEAEKITRLYEDVEGGTKVGKYLASKLGWMWGADPIFKETWERSTKNTAIETQMIANMSKSVSKLTPETAQKILTKDETGRFVRTPIEMLRGELSPEDFNTVSEIYTKIDDLGQQAVDLGLLGKEKFEENFGTYLKSAYEEYELAKNKNIFGTSKAGIKQIKARKEGLTPEMMQELGQIDNPAYLLFKSAFDLSRNVENAKLFKEISTKYGTDIAQEGFTQIPKTSKFTTTAGKQAEILGGVKKINNDIKPLLDELKYTFKADKEVLGDIARMESKLDELGKMQADELYKFFNEGVDITKTVVTPRKLGIIDEALQPIANSVKKFNTFQDLSKAPEGIQLEKLFINGDLKRKGFKSMEDFFDTVKNPYKAGEETTKTSKAVGDILKVESLQKEIERLISKSKTLKEIDKTSINDSFRTLEKNINDLRFTKEDMLQTLQDVKLGDLAGKYIPNHMYEYLREIIEPSKDTIAKQLVANFKFFKVIMNPATHARNIISNKVLNYWKLGMNPLDPRVIKSDALAVKEILSGTGRFTEEAKPLGYNLDTFASAEMKGLLDSPEVNTWGKGVKGWKTIKEKLGNIYQAEENHAKLSAYIFNRTSKGLSPKEAWKAAESATFNYAQVTPFVRKLRESLFGFPFITFTVKSTPVALETAFKKPGRISVIGKIKQGIENLSDIKETDRERANEPAWVKDGFYIKLPIKDKEGRSAYFDLTYILPFGDLVSGNFFERGTNMQTGLPESQVQALMKKSPFIQLVSEIGKNQDFYGNSIWRNSDSSDKQLGDLMRHLTKTIAPPLISDQIPGGYNAKGERQQKGFIGAATQGDKETQQRTLMQELLRTVGAKIQPIDADIQETYQEWNKKKALQNLLLERGVLNSLTKTYIPKE